MKTIILISVSLAIVWSLPWVAAEESTRTGSRELAQATPPASTNKEPYFKLPTRSRSTVRPAGTNTTRTTTTTTSTNKAPQGTTTTRSTTTQTTTTTPTRPGTTRVPAPAQPAVTPAATDDQPPGFDSAAPAGAAAAPTQDLIKAHTIKMAGFKIDQILDYYEGLTGKTIIRTPTLQEPANGFHLENMSDWTVTEAIEAIDTLLSHNNIAVVALGHNDKLLVAVQAGGAIGSSVFQEGVPITTAGALPEASQYVVHVVQLKNALPTEVQPVLQQFSKLPGGAGITAIDSSNILVLRDYAVNINRMLEIIEKIDVEVPMDLEPQVIPIKYALVADIAEVLGSMTTGGVGPSIGASTTGGVGGIGGTSSRSVRGSSRQRTTSRIGGTANQFGQPGFTGGVNSFSPNATASPLNTAGASALNRSDFQSRLGRITSGLGGGDFAILGDTKIIPDERTNSLLVFATRQDMKRIEEIIAKLDVVLPQVLIEAIIMEVSLDKGLNWGVSYAQNSQEFGNNNFGAGSVNNGPNFLNPRSFASVSNFTGSAGGFSYFATIGDDFNVALSAVESDTRINVLSRPRIQTSHAVPATLFVGESRPYISGTQYDFNNNARSQYQEKSIGITLDVVPLINQEGLVVMDLVTEIQQVAGSVTIDDNEVPITTDRSANSKVAVRNGETIILGGFISSVNTKSRTGVPLLKDIPGLGALFRSNNDTKNRVELMVMIRPTVLPNPAMAAIVATQEKNAMPILKEAEIMEHREQQKALRKVRSKDDSFDKEELRRQGVLN